LGQIKEITVFSIGDSRELSTWSNVPYFLSKSLEDKNIKINRVNIEENRILSLLYKYSIFAFLKLFYKNSDHTYFRSGINNYITNLKIKNVVKKYNNADVLLFLTYSFSAKKYTNKKIALFSDWSYLYKIDIFFKRKAFWFEKKALKREEENINTADTLISLFPRSKEFNKSNYTVKDLNYLGNVINCNFWHNKAEIIAKKTNSNKLLFIGTRKYKKGALDLIQAFKELSVRKDNKLELHIIGLDQQELNISLPNLFYFGYLNKSIQQENELYYKLLSEAKVIINTNVNWGAFSAMTEAMYFYTPVITTPYAEFTETYGTEINFGYYVNDNSASELISAIEKITTNSNEVQLAFMNNAYEKVKDFSWSNYSDKLLEVFTKI
jgi:glycosyltransferase involved in cell wall biosynthesis